MMNDTFMVGNTGGFYPQIAQMTQIFTQANLRNLRMGQSSRRLHSERGAIDEKTRRLRARYFGQADAVRTPGVFSLLKSLTTFAL